LLLQLLRKRKELDPSQLLFTSEGCCCWEQGPLLLLTDKEELARLAQPDKKGDRNLRMLNTEMKEGPLVASRRLGF